MPVIWDFESCYTWQGCTLNVTGEDVKNIAVMLHFIAFYAAVGENPQVMAASKLTASSALFAV